MLAVRNCPRVSPREVCPGYSLTRTALATGRPYCLAPPKPEARENIRNHAVAVDSESAASTSRPAVVVKKYDGKIPRTNIHDKQGRLMFKNLTFAEVQQWCIDHGEDLRRATHIWRWMYADEGKWIRSFEDTFDRQGRFSEKWVEKYKDEISIDGGLELQHVARAADGTRKLVFKLTSGEGAGGVVETVLIPVVRVKGRRDRITVCVSSQVGCAMNCQFCYTGRMGLLGNLSTAQIVEQVVEARRFMDTEGDRTPITNVVFMGMGEPLNNFEPVVTACAVMCDHLGLHMGHGKVTLSTVGLVPEMKEFVRRSNCQVALSLHATTDEVRDWIAPVNRRYNLATLKAALFELFPRNEVNKERLMIEYVMLRGINDTLEDAERLVKFTEDLHVKINLIIFNAHQGTVFQPSEDSQIGAFRDILMDAGRICTVRDSRGDDSMAACGQLGNPATSWKPVPLLDIPDRFKHLIPTPPSL